MVQMLFLNGTRPEMYDISVPVDAETPVWPGDIPPQIDVLASHEGGAGYHLSRIALTVHTGTHIDAPYHFVPAGKKLAELPLSRFVLPARVIVFNGEGPIPGNWLEDIDLDGAEAVLFKTRNSEWWQKGDRQFHREYVALSLEAAQLLVRKGMRLVGIDYLSVDPWESGAYAVHHHLLGNDVIILENACLGAVLPGDYWLFCAPIRWAVPDGAPVRAFLVPRQ